MLQWVYKRCAAVQVLAIIWGSARLEATITALLLCNVVHVKHFDLMSAYVIPIA